MSTTEPSFKVGSIVSADLTVPDADEVRDFYQGVIGWTVENIDMGDYDDYLVKTADRTRPVGGICHKRGVNEGLPPVWMLYVNVEDLSHSAKRCVEMGGKVLVENDQYAVIQDPAGAVLAITRVVDEPAP